MQQPRHLGVECIINAWNNIRQYKQQNVYYLVCKFNLLFSSKGKLLLQMDKSDFSLNCREEMHFTHKTLRSQSHSCQN